MAEVSDLESELKRLVNQKHELTSGRKRLRSASSTVLPKRATKRLKSPETEPRPKIDLDAVDASRSRKLFGSMLAHLHRASQNAEREKGESPHQKQAVLAQEVEEKLARHAEALEAAQKADDEERRVRRAARLQSLSCEIAVKDSELVRVKLDEHFSSMKCFIQTTTEPRLFWRPASHNSCTAELQKKTAEEIEATIGQLRKDFDPEEIRRQLTGA
ncbi:MAG: uncharacterized protein KVP18_000386 [Porospora cf. gigantea A]|uniref:uncharacterized protein n=1 Tax=Porospora cf. gigantea A TaxID=2853593 RepID=UPI00355A9F0D|nr:MAG: hypothetical protein KVP18_000386 [Porospora cf. gigantea A]